MDMMDVLMSFLYIPAAPPPHPLDRVLSIYVFPVGVVWFQVIVSYELIENEAFIVE